MKSRTPYTVSRKVLIIANRQMPAEDASVADGGEDSRYGSVYGGMFQDNICGFEGYRSVVLFVRKGLGKEEIIRPVIEAIWEIQKHGNRSWSLVPMSHGWGEGVQNTDNYPNKETTFYHRNREKIIKSICELAGEELENGCLTISELYPRTREQKLCRGKTNISSDDLIIFMDTEDSPIFPYRKKYRFSLNAKRRMIFVRVAEDLSGAEWKMSPSEIKFEEKRPE